MSTACPRSPRPWTGAGGAPRGVLAALLAGALCLPQGAAAAYTTVAAAYNTRAGAPGATLTFGGPALLSLDPVKANNGANGWPLYLTYDSLTRLQPDGQLAPDLATSWGYLGTGNTEFQITLRSGVRFSDGTPLTAAGLKAWFTYFKDANGTFSGLLAALASVEVTGPLTVRLHLSQPNPLLPRYFCQDYLMGFVASASALEHPTQLGTQTFGAGPYMLDAAASVAGDHYTLVPNPYYWNKPAIHYARIVYRVIASYPAALQALRTGQIDVTAGDYTTATAAKSAGLTVEAVPFIWEGLILADRNGTVARPLADVRVRQALNYAVDRRAIASGLYRAYGTPSDEIESPGQDGWVAADSAYYTYDPAKARALLTAAGYPNGFTLSLLTTSVFNQDVVAQAIASYLQKAGVAVQLTDDAEAGKFYSDMASQRFPAMTVAYGGVPMYIEYASLFGPAGTYNPFHSTDSQVEALNTAAATGRPAATATSYHTIEHRLLTLGWFLPVVLTPEFTFVRSSVVAGVQMTVSRPIPDPVEWRPAS